MNSIIKMVEQMYAKKDHRQKKFQVGDTIAVHVKIKEGNKERIQIFQGIVLQIKGTNTNGETFTVRKISNNIAVEKIFPICSPSIEKIEIKRRGAVRRAKLYYLRGKKGKAANVKEKKKALIE